MSQLYFPCVLSTHTRNLCIFQNTVVLIPLLFTKSNLKVATKNMNIIRAVLKNIIDLFVHVWVDIKLLKSHPCRVLLTYAGLNKLSLSYYKKKLSTTLQFYEPVKVKAMHIKFFMHRELLRYATIGYIINFCRDPWAIYSQHFPS